MTEENIVILFYFTLVLYNFYTIINY